MKKYTTDELVVLTQKISDCFYSWNQVSYFSIRTFGILRHGKQPAEEDEFRMNYYRERFLHEISELYTYFYKHEDTKILQVLHASEDERLKLREVRHPIAHVDGDIEKYLKVQKDFFASLSSNTNQIRDLILMILHMRFLLKFVNGEHLLISMLKIVLCLYPPDHISPEIRKQILE